MNIFGQGKLEKVNKFLLYSLIFLLPIFFLPFGTNFLDFQKQTLLLILVFLSFFLWLLRSLISSSIKLKFPLPFFFLIFLILIVLFSSIFSLYPYGSFWGTPLKNSQSFFTIFAFSLFLFLFVNTFNEKKEITFAIFLLFFSSFLVALFGLFQLFGQFIFPWNFTKIPSFNTIGSINSWGIFLASLLPLLILFLVFQKSKLKWFLIIVFSLFVFAIFLVNFWVVWLLVLLGMVTIFIFCFYDKERKKGWLILPLSLLAFSLVFLILGNRINLGFLLPQNLLNFLEVSPSFPFTLKITQQTLFPEDEILSKNFFFGSGPGTFVYNFSKYKGADFNQTLFWNFRFTSGASEILEKIITIGTLGIIFWILFFVALTLFALRTFLRAKEGEEKFDSIIYLASFVSFLIVGLSFFFYPANLGTEFLFWFLAAVILSLGLTKSKIVELVPGKLRTIFFSLIFLLFLVGGIIIFLFEIQRYLAEVYYGQGLVSFNRGENDKATTKILRAIQLNPSVDLFWRDLSQVAFRQLSQELVKEKPDNQKIQNFFVLSVNSAKRATEISENDVSNWLNHGFILRSAIGLVEGSFEAAVRSYEKAKKLEPANPFIPLELARSYLASGILAQQKNDEEKTKGNFQKAKEHLELALSLKPDYWPAHFQQAILFDIEGKLDEAIAKLEEIKPFNQQDVILAFQLGSYYWRKEDLKKAQSEFERAVQFNPNFANARYFLGLIYDREGEKEKALKEFELIASYSEENKKQVEKIIENIKAGLPALGPEVQVPPQPEEIPPLEEE